MVKGRRRVAGVECAAVGDEDGLQRPVLAVLGRLLDGPEDSLVAFQHAAEHHMLPIQVAGGTGGDEELRAPTTYHDESVGKGEERNLH